MHLTLSDGSNLPPIGFGTTTFKKSELTKALEHALETGYRHIDCCFYQNEHIIGKVLQKWFKQKKLKREEIFITTNLPPGALYTDKVEICMKKSLSNLHLDYVDLYLIQFPVPFQIKESYSNYEPLKDNNGEVILDSRADHAAVWKKMEEQVDAGRARYIGLSNYNQSQIQTVLQSARIKPSCLQIEMHIFLQQHPLVEFCQKHDIVVVAFAPLGSPDYNDKLKSMGLHEQKLPDLLGNPTVKEISQKYKKTEAQILLRFLVQSGVVPIPKSLHEGRIKENFDIFDFELDRYDYKILMGLDMGEAGRISDFKNVWKGVDNHPHYPFEKLES